MNVLATQLAINPIQRSYLAAQLALVSVQGAYAGASNPWRNIHIARKPGESPRPIAEIFYEPTLEEEDDNAEEEDEEEE